MRMEPIVRLCTAPYSPEQNAVGGRPNRTVWKAQERSRIRIVYIKERFVNWLYLISFTRYEFDYGYLRWHELWTTIMPFADPCRSQSSAKKISTLNRRRVAPYFSPARTKLDFFLAKHRFT